MKGYLALLLCIKPQPLFESMSLFAWLPGVYLLITAASYVLKVGSSPAEDGTETKSGYRVGLSAMI